MKTIIMCAAAWLLSLPVTAQDVCEEIAANPNVAGCNYMAYPGPKQTVLTAAPEGYTPYYISHYGRHGSRYLIDQRDYDAPRATLMKADSLGILSQTGRDVLQRVERMRTESWKRLGELTPLGAEQHRGIARRMVERFPEVFEGDVVVDAKSTFVIRCILSMENELLEMAALRPSLRFKHDASWHDMYYMNQSTKYLDSLKNRPEVKQTLKAFEQAHAHPERVMSLLFDNGKQETTAGFLSEDEQRGLYRQLIDLATALQNTELRHEMTLYDLFTTDELYENWQRTNAWWYQNNGAAPLTGTVQPYSQRNLLRKIVEEADSCLVMERPGATLRFGHEGMVMSLSCLLDIDQYATQTSLDSLEIKNWLSHNIFPMACNLQFVFYKKTGTSIQKTGEGIQEKAPVLVKVLLNENEATLPLPAVSGPYYRWDDLRAYMLRILDRWKSIGQE